MQGTLKQIDPSVKDHLLRFPTVEMIRSLFPDVRMRGRSVLCNPLRGESHPSLSCFLGRNGFYRWHDFTTGESGDNIDFYRKVYPELGYADAVDSLSRLLLGRSAFEEASLSGSAPVRRTPARIVQHRAAAEPDPVLRIVSVSPFVPDGGGVPSHLLDYSLRRGISPEVSSVLFSFVRFCNTGRVGRTLLDPVSGLPLLSEDGSPLRDDGLNDAVGFANDIGGFALRAPDRPGGEGFKKTDVSGISTLLQGTLRPQRSVVFESGEPFVEVGRMRYDLSGEFLSFSSGKGFRGVKPWAVPYAMAFLEEWDGRYLEGRDLRKAVAVLDSLNGPVCRSVEVVEGMFDAASLVEMARPEAGLGGAPPVDIVVLNSTSNVRWAVPFLSRHREVLSCLDNDLSSGAGRKAFEVLAGRVEAFSRRVGVSCSVMDRSSRFAPCKDVNDYLVSVFLPERSARLSAVSGEKEAQDHEVRPSTLKVRPVSIL